MTEVLNSLFLFFRQKKSVSLFSTEQELNCLNENFLIDSARNAK